MDNGQFFYDDEEALIANQTKRGKKCDNDVDGNVVVDVCVDVVVVDERLNKQILVCTRPTDSVRQPLNLRQIMLRISFEIMKKQNKLFLVLY